jgi:hypothetical protein
VTVGDWVCECGQGYRVVVEDGAVRMWPETAADDYRNEPIDGDCACGRPIDAKWVAARLRTA